MQFRALRDTLLKAIAAKAELTVHYLRKGGWDFFGQVFTESHCVGHQCWHLHDTTHPRHDPEIVRRVGDPIKDIYKAIDQALGRILLEVGQDTVVIFLSGHGMGPKYHAQFLLDRILVALNVSVPARSFQETENSKEPTASWSTRPLLRWGWEHLPNEAQFKLAPLEKQMRKWIDGPRALSTPTIERAESHCFPVQNNFAHGGIRVNLIGREPNGQISRGTEYERFCRTLARDLLEIINVDTGKPVAKRVIQTSEMYQGPYLDDLPDLLVDWTNEAPVYTVTSPKIGEVRGAYTYRRTGEHRPGGLFTAVGPSIERGNLDRPVSVLDFAPTITRLLGIDLQGVDGIPIPEILATHMHTVRTP